MGSSMRRSTSSAQRLLSDVHAPMLKAGIRKPEITEGVPPDSGDGDAWKARIGQAIARMQGLAGLSLKELADLIGRDERQVKRWMVGTERPQFDAIFAVETLRAVLVVALAELAHDIEVITEIRVRRRRVA